MGNFSNIELDKTTDLNATESKSSDNNKNITEEIKESAEINNSVFQNVEDKQSVVKTHHSLDERELSKAESSVSNKSFFPSTLKVGDTCKFGKFFLDNNNSTEPIEWLVLSVESDKALLITKYAIDSACFDCEEVDDGFEWEDINWANSQMRLWCNKDFYLNSFTKEEQTKIIPTSLKNDSEYVDDEENEEPDTIDKVFLLNSKEVKTYFSFDRKCTKTIYAKTKWDEIVIDSVDEDDDINNPNNYVQWWLRSKADTDNCFNVVGDVDYKDVKDQETGKLKTSGTFNPEEILDFGVDSDCVACVRPAMWVSLDPSYISPKYKFKSVKKKQVKKKKKEIVIPENILNQKNVDCNDLDILTTPKVQIGKVYTIGSYYQQNDGNRQPIEWIVLKIKKGKALLITKRCLESKSYNDDESVITTWEDSSLRKWCNDDFYQQSFTDEEKSRIVSITLNNDQPIDENHLPGKQTQDKVFIMSFKEITTYYPNPSSIKFLGTAYSFSKNSFGFAMDDDSNYTGYIDSLLLRNSSKDGQYSFGSISFMDESLYCDSSQSFGLETPILLSMWVQLRNDQISLANDYEDSSTTNVGNRTSSKVSKVRANSIETQLDESSDKNQGCLARIFEFLGKVIVAFIGFIIFLIICAIIFV